MKKICFTLVLAVVLVMSGSSFADETSFGVNPPMTDVTAAQETSTARDLAERGLIPLDGEGWAKRPMVPAAGYNADGIADTSPPASVSKPTSPSAPIAPKAPKF